MGLRSKLGDSVFATSALWLSFLVMAGCGYHFQEAGGPAKSRIGSVAIPLIKSPSTRLGFEGDFTTILRNEFILHGAIPLVPKKEAAAVLLGEVTEVVTDPLSYNILRTPVDNETAVYETTNNRRLTIRFAARLVDQATGKIIWEDRRMEEKSSFPVTTDPLKNRYYRRRAVEVIAERIARRIYDKTIAGF